MPISRINITGNAVSFPVRILSAREPFPAPFPVLTAPETASEANAETAPEIMSLTVSEPPWLSMNLFARVLHPERFSSDIRYFSASLSVKSLPLSRSRRAKTVACLRAVPVPMSRVCTAVIYSFIGSGYLISGTLSDGLPSAGKQLCGFSPPSCTHHDDGDTEAFGNQLPVNRDPALSGFIDKIYAYDRVSADLKYLGGKKKVALEAGCVAYYDRTVILSEIYAVARGLFLR